MNHNPITGIKSAFIKNKTTNTPHFTPEQLRELMRVIAEAKLCFFVNTKNLTGIKK